ncbi:phage head closure protein [Rhizobiales bacterium RZME27]|uniref:Phage head closure protein n=1 Tax=Endobacterium cereale TaxID=2663029 RepID=A0A6A8ACK1_9HYPH|nr:phage head closure protein [Endobacterium cereale]MEB2847135.1 phage head closure protein [Endobacterium cereale]MQY47450.1 phage head closure protein [Endobacterium cereale]
MPVTFFDPGQMTARLDLETAEPQSDGQGGAVPVWSVLSSMWARIEPVSFVVSEKGAATETAVVTHRIWVRFRDSILGGQRFRKGERLFVIRAVRDPDETRRYLVCHCEEEGA